MPAASLNTRVHRSGAPACAAWLQSHRGQDTGLWMLKNNKQRGTGLRLVRTDEAFQACFETTYRPGLEGIKLYRRAGSMFTSGRTTRACAFPTTLHTRRPTYAWRRWYLAQQYITHPMLLDGHKFGIRIWALVPGVRPLRVYVHRNGLVLMSSHK